MKLSLFKTAIMFVLLLTTTAYCQQQGLSFSYFGGGARSEGMGQAYIALSDDGAAGSWNPAALYVHEQVLLGFNLGSLKPRGYNKFYATGTRILKYDHSGSFGGITDLNLIAPLRIKDHHVVMNLSYVENVNSYFEFREKLYDWSDFNPLDTLDDYDPNALMQRKGGIHSANLALGTRVNKEISFGIAANIYTGKLVTDERRTAILDIVDVGGDANKIAEFHTIDSTSYSGFNFTLGLLYTSGKFRSGLTLRTPFILKAASDSTLFMESTKR